MLRRQHAHGAWRTVGGKTFFVSANATNLTTTAAVVGRKTRLNPNPNPHPLSMLAAVTPPPTVHAPAKLNPLRPAPKLSLSPSLPAAEPACGTLLHHHQHRSAPSLAPGRSPSLAPSKSPVLRAGKSPVLRARKSPGLRPSRSPSLLPASRPSCFRPGAPKYESLFLRTPLSSYLDTDTALTLLRVSKGIHARILADLWGTIFARGGSLRAQLASACRVPDFNLILGGKGFFCVALLCKWLEAERRIKRRVTAEGEATLPEARNFALQCAAALFTCLDPQADSTEVLYSFMLKVL
eukprot:TRINITY_DN9584_c0_g1_i2.p1 TRINITY_DN9584_c0_g1~~TRINITY_DN9584_c0_g1_i2.p1  ORF type:complete len:295 (-),score=86.27 TRINITY_DN9584_c0_g1_i2:27-911(-)